MYRLSDNGSSDVDHEVERLARQLQVELDVGRTEAVAFNGVDTCEVPLIILLVLTHTKAPVSVLIGHQSEHVTI